jgi:hypothetical protein
MRVKGAVPVGVDRQPERFGAEWEQPYSASVLSRPRSCVCDLNSWLSDQRKQVGPSLQRSNDCNTRLQRQQPSLPDHHHHPANAVRVDIAIEIRNARVLSA